MYCNRIESVNERKIYKQKLWNNYLNEVFDKESNLLVELNRGERQDWIEYEQEFSVGFGLFF